MHKSRPERSGYWFDPTANQAINMVQVSQPKLQQPSQIAEQAKPPVSAQNEITQKSIEDQLMALNKRFPRQRKIPFSNRDPEYVRLKAEIESQRIRILFPQD